MYFHKIMLNVYKIIDKSNETTIIVVEVKILNVEM